MWISLYARIFIICSFLFVSAWIMRIAFQEEKYPFGSWCTRPQNSFYIINVKKKTGKNCLKTCLRLTDSPSNGEGLGKNVLVLIVWIRIRIRIRKFKNTGTVRIQFGSGYTTQVLRQFNLCICWRGFTCWMYLFWSWKLTLYFSSLGTLLDLLMEMASVLAISAASHVSCIWTGGKTLVLT